MSVSCLKLFISPKRLSYPNVKELEYLGSHVIPKFVCLCVSNHNYFSYFYINVANAVILVYLDFPCEPFQRNVNLGDLCIWGAILSIGGYRSVGQI